MTDHAQSHECQAGEHQYCDGNDDILADGVIVFRVRCACTCHIPTRLDRIVPQSLHMQ
ncbi:hypothetical protein [Streptomyces sp. NPDC088258]|uniref:hypothetical protein n=1 Tax=Streptomyces sp. NPDC088258 TaxID=3365849 RepID=UPI00381CEA48